MLGRAGAQAAEGLLDRGDYSAGVDPAGGADDDVGADVAALDEAEQVVAAEAADVALQADHRQAGGMAAEREPVEQLERGRERILLVLDVLLQQHLALALELGFGEAGVEDDVAEHAHEVGGIARHAAHVEGGVVLVGVGVDVGAELFGVEVDLLAAAAGRALEGHVLDEVADAAFLPAFAGAAAVHEHADARAFQMRQGNGDDAHAVAEGGEQGVAGRGKGRHESGHCEWHRDCVADRRILEGGRRRRHPSSNARRQACRSGSVSRWRTAARSRRRCCWCSTSITRGLPTWCGPTCS